LAEDRGERRPLPRTPFATPDLSIRFEGRLAAAQHSPPHAIGWTDGPVPSAGAFDYAVGADCRAPLLIPDHEESAVI